MYIKHLEQTRHLVSTTDIFAVQVQGCFPEILQTPLSCPDLCTWEVSPRMKAAFQFGGGGGGLPGLGLLLV